MDHSTVIILSSIFNFSVVALILFLAAKKMLPAVLSKRSDEVSLSMREAEAQFKEAESALQKWETNYKTSQVQAEQLHRDAETSIARLREETISAAKKQAVRLESDSKLLAVSEKKRAQSSLLREIVERSVRLVDDHFSEELGDPERKRLFARALENV